MENEKQIPEPEQEEDILVREERCEKAIKIVSKAIFMRFAVAAILIWVVLRTSMEPWIIGLMAFVLVIDLSGILPLASELKKRRKELKEIIAEDEAS